MKLSDKELREIAANPNDEGAPVCAELLTLRREVRRLRRALRDVLDKTTIKTGAGPSLAKWLVNPAHDVARAALKPKRGVK